MRLFFDVNVILDVLAQRDPWARDSAAALSLAAEGEAEGFLAAHTVTTLHYLLGKELGAARAASTLVELLSFLDVVAVDHEVLLQAFSLRTGDFEDSVQAVCALEANADYLLTRDCRSFEHLDIPVATPSEFLGILTESEEDVIEEDG